MSEDATPLEQVIPGERESDDISCWEDLGGKVALEQDGEEVVISRDQIPAVIEYLQRFANKD